MNNFTERHHAYISAMYYKLMKEQNFHDFREVFVKATSTYAMQRGQRMALRALRDGRPLNFASYRYYGEWVYTEQSLQEAAQNGKLPTEVSVQGDDVVMKIHACPWSDQYLDMGLLDGAMDYCKDLDVAIARGFNPQLTYQVNKVMHQNKDYCLHCQQGASMGLEQAYGDKNFDNVKSFDYHCAHVYYTFSSVMLSVYGALGQHLNAQVLSDFSNTYGSEMADVLVSFRHTDWNSI